MSREVTAYGALPWFGTPCAGILGSVAAQPRCTADMNMKMKRTAAAALMAGLGAAASVGFADTAQATYGAGEGSIDAWSNYQWCPGDPIPQSDNALPFGTNACHFWHYQSVRDGAPTLYWIVEGIRPSQCPPFAFMCP